jgi:hypothetical protein
MKTETPSSLWPVLLEWPDKVLNPFPETLWQETPGETVASFHAKKNMRKLRNPVKLKKVI